MDGVPLRKVFLSPGEVAHAAEPTLITTVLGSCVAVTLWDAERRVGGVNHFVLPPGKTRQSSARYGDVAMRQLLDGMAAMGARKRHLEAKLFGGASVLATSDQRSVGEANVSFALRMLEECGVRVAAHRTGGQRGRLLIFNTGSGDAFVRWLMDSESPPVQGRPPASARRQSP